LIALKVLNLRELATVTPTHFFGHVNEFFENIFIAINDPKIRESAVSALRSALYVVSERERVSHDLKDNKSRIDQQIPSCFKTCFEEVIKGFDDREKTTRERDDKIHGSLLILNELLRCSNDSGIVHKFICKFTGH
jgi:FKBP12-rapamycin complex-associated protein